MRRTIAVAPERVLAEAQAFMVNHGARVEAQSGTSVTFAVQEMPTYGLLGMVVGSALMGADAMFSAHTAANTLLQGGGTLVAAPSGEGTTVTIPDGDTRAARLLRFWLLADALREPLANPMGQFKLGSHPWWIWADRIEDYRRSFTWKLKDTLPMEDVAAVATPKRSLITALAKDGRELKFKGLSKDKTEQARTIIESRMVVYASPPLVEGGAA